MLTRKLPCPSCGVRLKIADDLPAGKNITCPKCGQGFSVPEGNGEASSPQAAMVRVRKPAPEEDEERDEEENEEIEERPVVRKRRRPPPPDDDDEVEEEERPLPRKRRKFRKKKPSRLPLILGVIAGGILLLVAAGVTLAVIKFWPKEDNSTSVSQNSSPSRPSGRMAGGRAGQNEPGADRSTPGGGSTQPEPTGDASEPFAAGKQVFQRNCARCHRIGGSSGEGGMRGRGPDLATVGRDHDADWLMGYIRDPKSRKPDSRMLPQRLSDEDLRAVAVYLASLK
jgi:mono/diheme cytochrome c family protein